MKKTLLIILLTFFVSHLQAQEFLDDVAKDMCECIQSKEIEEMTQNQFVIQLSDCFILWIANNKNEFDTYTNGKALSEEDLQSFGREVGIHMAKFCQDNIMRFIAKESTNQADETFANEIGQIISIENQLFNIVHFKSLDGSLLKFLWLYEFEGDQILIEKKFKNKQVSILFDTFSFYDPKSNSYINYRVIDRIQEIE